MPIFFKDLTMGSILDQLVNCYFNRTYRSSSVGCNKQITQAQRGQGCLEEVFTILAVSIRISSHANRSSYYKICLKLYPGKYACDRPV